MGKQGAVWLIVGLLATCTQGRAQTVFTTDFESGLPAEFSAPGASVESVDGYAGIGAPGNQFAGNFLRYSSPSVVDTILTLTGLPSHDTLSLGFLLAVIDSWDGTELFEVIVDGATLFSHTFQLAEGDASSYDAPPGALLSSGTNIGFSGGFFWDHDRAYDLSADPAFGAIPHTADSVTIVWRLVAAPGAWQGALDESWAIDNLTVAVSNGSATTTTTATSSSTTTTVVTSTTSTTVEPSSTTTTTATSSTSTTTVPAQLLSGKKLLLKWRPDDTKKSLLDLLAKDAALTLGDGPDSADDPTLAGGSLRIYAAGGDGFDDTYELPAAQWRYASKKKPESGYKFGKGDPITSVLVKAGKQVKIVGKGTALGHTLASDPRPVLIELRLGAERYCFEFGGSVTFAANKKYLAKKAPAASACPP
jgi:hypothetical protein